MPTDRGEPFVEALIDFAWDEWAQIGFFTEARRVSPWAIDPEALILFTLELGRYDARLFDEMLDWCAENYALLSVRRLRACTRDEDDLRLLSALLRWVSGTVPRARLASDAPPRDGEPIVLFLDGGPMVRPDPAFAESGFLRPTAHRSNKSRPPGSHRPATLAFQLRRLLGVGLRAELIRVLTTTSSPSTNASTLERSAGFTKRNVLEVLGGFVAAQVVDSTIVGNEQRFSAASDRWAPLVQPEPLTWATHKDWPQLLGAARLLVRARRAADDAEPGSYRRASELRNAMEATRADLAFAGLTVPFSGGPEAVDDDFGVLMRAVVAAIRT